MIKKITNKLINWLEKIYLKDKKEKLDELYNEQLRQLKELFKHKTIKEILWEMVFEYDFKEPVNLKERYRIYSKLNSDIDYLKLFKSKYFKNYQAYFNAKSEEERNILKGRLAELEDIILSMNDAKNKLDNWEQIEKLQEKKIVLKSDIREKILINNNN